jgi:hypothetical protein
MLSTVTPAEPSTLPSYTRNVQANVSYRRCSCPGLHMIHLVNTWCVCNLTNDELECSMLFVFHRCKR